MKVIFSEQQPAVWYVLIDEGIADIVICLNEEEVQVADESEESGYHIDYQYDYNKFQTDTLTEEEVLENPERYLGFEGDYFSESDRIDFLDTEYAKTNLANVPNGAVTEEKIADESITREKITLDDIIGTNGWHNLREGTFDYGNGKFKWDGENLNVEGIIRALGGDIAGWDILEDGLSREGDYPGTPYEHEWNSVDGKISFSSIPLREGPYGDQYLEFNEVVSAEFEAHADGEDDGRIVGFYVSADGSFYFGDLKKGSFGDLGNYLTFERRTGRLQYSGDHIEVNIKTFYLKSEDLGYETLMMVNDAGRIVSADSGWTTPSLASNFDLYGATPVRYKKVGRKTIMEGVVTPKSTITGSATATTIFTLTQSQYRPATTKQQICQGSGKNTWLLSVAPSGVVGIARYGTTAISDIPAGAWLPFYFEFEID